MVAKKKPGKTKAKVQVKKNVTKAKGATPRAATKAVAKTKAKNKPAKAKKVQAMFDVGPHLEGIKAHAKANAPGTPWKKHLTNIITALNKPA